MNRPVDNLRGGPDLSGYNLNVNDRGLTVVTRALPLGADFVAVGNGGSTLAPSNGRLNGDAERTVVGGDTLTRVFAPLGRDVILRRVQDKHFVVPDGVEISIAHPAPKIVVGSDFGDIYHHERIRAGVTDQLHQRNVPVPEIATTPEGKPFDIWHASFALATLLDNVPRGTVGTWVTDPTVNALPGTESFRDEIIFETTAGNYVVIPNNGLATFTTIFQGIEKAWRVDHDFFLGRLNGSSSCQGEDLFGPATGLAALDPANIKKFATPIDISEVKTFPVVEGQALDVDRFGQVRYASYLSPDAIAADVLCDDGVVRRLPVQQEGGFADFPDADTYLYPSSGFKIDGMGLAEAARNKQPAVDVVGVNSRILRVISSSDQGTTTVFEEIK